MFKKSTLIIALAAALALPLTLSAESTPPPAPEQASLDNIPTILQFAAKTRGWLVVNHFKTPSDLNGWIIKTPNGNTVGFTDAAGFLLLGEMVSPDGVLMNTEFLATYSPKNDTSVLEYDFEAILSNATFLNISKEGATGEPLIVFFEPFCPHCSNIYAALKPYIDAGLPVQLLPVSFLSDGTRGRPHSTDLIYSASISSDPLAFIDKHENGGLTPADITKAPADFAQKMQANLTAMSALGISGTPAVLAPNGDSFTIERSFTMGKIAELAKMPRMDANNPKLNALGADPTTYPVK